MWSMAYWNPIDFIFLFCDFIAPCKMRVGFCEVDIYETISHKSLLLETLLLCYYCCCYSCHCRWYCYLSVPSRKILKTEKCKYCFDVNNTTWKLLSRELKADSWSIFYPDAMRSAIQWCELMKMSEERFKLHNKRRSRGARSFWAWVSPSVQLSPITSSHDPLHQAIPVSGHTD